MFYEIYILYILYINLYKSFPTMLDSLKNNNKKRDGEIGKHKLNEMRALNMK